MQRDDVLAESVRMAETIARTEDEVAATLDVLAQTQPHRAEYLHALSDSARSHAAYVRRWAKARSERPEYG